MTNFLFWMYENALWIGIAIFITIVGYWGYTSFIEVTDALKSLKPSN